MQVQAPALASSAGVALNLSGHFTTLADGMSLAAGTFPGPSPAWEGPAARALARLLAAQPTALEQVARAGREAASALTDYAESLLVAAQLAQDAEHASQSLAQELLQRARAMVERAGADATERLLAVGRRAPETASPVVWALRRVRGEQAKVWLEAGESGEVAVSWAAHLAGVIRHRLD
jgi:hypothetical protein